jgi:hypothetical protein
MTFFVKSSRFSNSSRMNKNISKEYICGLFDGEGCIYIFKGPSNTSSLNGVVMISNTNFHIIEAASQKLTELNIKNKIITRDIKNRKTIYNLVIKDIYNIYKFYKIIGTFYEAKDKKFKKLFKNNEKLRRSNLVKKVFKLREQGLSYKKMGKIVKISPSSICHILNRKFYQKVISD